MDSSLEIDIDEVKERIRKGAALRRAEADASFDISTFFTPGPLSHVSLPASLVRELSENNDERPQFVRQEDNHYQLSELLKFQDAEFVRTAYRALLKREPDAEGYRNKLQALRSGRFDKVDILASLQASQEGRAKNVRVRGLAFPATLRRLSRLPILGYPISILINLSYLPELARRQQASEQGVERLSLLLPEILETLSHLSETLSSLSETQTEAMRKLSEAQSEISGLQQRQIHALFREQKELIREQKGLHEEIYVRPLELQEEVRRVGEEQRRQAESLIDFVEAELRQLSEKLQQTRSAIALEERRLTKFIEESRRDGAAQRETTPPRPLHTEHNLDALYASFEKLFRGEGKDVRERFKVYLPFLERSEIRGGIVDIGCGSGDWLKLLRDEGFGAKGVETNSILVEECLARGLEVEGADMFDFLSRQPDSSLSCVTAFHLIEHLQFEALVRFVDEILRVLRPGGLVIFETPNPENVVIGSCNFYLDPTHHHPLPRALMKFLLEERGFQRLQILRLHPIDSMRVEGDTPLTARFNDHLYGPMDYAVIGWKA